jgi:protein PhnA
MKLEEAMRERSGGRCELCSGQDDLQLYEVLPQDGRDADNCVLLCAKCRNQVDKKEELDAAHWRVLSDSMWSEVPGVQVLAWRMLNRLRAESWAADLLDMFYLDEEKLAWAKATGDHENDGSVELHKDANGNQIFEGDSVVLIKSLDVKGSTLTAKLGTVVRNVRLVAHNKEQIEGRVEGQQIVILTKYVRRQGEAK